MTDENAPPSRLELIRTGLWEVGIGVVATIVLIGWRGGWRLFKAKPFTPEFLIEVAAIGCLVLAGAGLLAIRDYRAGVKELRKWEYRQMWGRDPD